MFHGDAVFAVFSQSCLYDPRLLTPFYPAPVRCSHRSGQLLSKRKQGRCVAQCSTSWLATRIAGHRLHTTCIERCKQYWHLLCRMASARRDAPSCPPINSRICVYTLCARRRTFPEAVLSTSSRNKRDVRSNGRFTAKGEPFVGLDSITYISSKRLFDAVRKHSSREHTASFICSIWWAH
jgi:hypothetical protein